jgi:hypothetical protein
VSVHFYWGAKCNLAHMWSKTKGSWQIMVADFSTNLCSLANQLGLADMPKLHYWNNKLLNSKHVQVESLNQPTCISKTCSICIKSMLFYFSTLKFIFLQKFQHYHTFLVCTLICIKLRRSTYLSWVVEINKVCFSRLSWYKLVTLMHVSWFSNMVKLVWKHG